LTGERGRIGAEIDEDVSVPDVDMNGIEGIVLVAEAFVAWGAPIRRPSSP